MVNRREAQDNQSREWVYTGMFSFDKNVLNCLELIVDETIRRWEMRAQHGQFMAMDMVIAMDVVKSPFLGKRF